MELKEKIKSVILAPLETEEDRMIGIELEDFVYDMKGKRIPVNPGSEYSASDLLNNLIDFQVNDKYKRLLGYVYLPDGKMLNEEIVKAGYANVMTIPPNVKYKDVFFKAYKYSKERKVGLWN